MGGNSNRFRSLSAWRLTLEPLAEALQGPSGELYGRVSGLTAERAPRGNLSG